MTKVQTLLRWVKCESHILKVWFKSRGPHTKTILFILTLWVLGTLFAKFPLLFLWILITVGIACLYWFIYLGFSEVF